MEERKHQGAPTPLFFSYRLVLALIGCLAFINLYALRVNISVAIVCMVNHTHLAIEMEIDSLNKSKDTANCANKLSSHKESSGEYAWHKHTQGIILGAFYWGYLFTQILGGVMSEWWGGKRVLGWCMFVALIGTLFTPLAASISPYMVIALRIIIGLGEGVVFPAMNSIWAKWAPPLERSKLIGFTFAGAQIGNVITLPASGLLCHYGFAGGWPSIFYVSGIFALVWFVLWMVLVSDSPSKHPYISVAEREYIKTSVGVKSISTIQMSQLSPPWLEIAKSPAVWAIIVAHTFSNWGTYTMLTNIPTYMREVLKFDIKENGFVSALPYVAFWAFINIGGNLADALRSRGWDTNLVRKISTSAGMLLPGLFLVLTGYITCEAPYAAVALLTIGIGFSGFQFSGVMVNHVDIAPPFAGTLFGISNTFATLSGILAPYLVAVITPNQSQSEWQVVFYIAALIYTLGAIFYVTFAAGEVQDWAKPYMMDDSLGDVILEDARLTPASDVTPIVPLMQENVVKA